MKLNLTISALKDVYLGEGQGWLRPGDTGRRLQS